MGCTASTQIIEPSQINNSNNILKISKLSKETSLPNYWDSNKVLIASEETMVNRKNVAKELGL